MSFILLETTGIEPVTPCMSSKYSNQLSYASVLRVIVYHTASKKAILFLNLHRLF